MSSLTEYFSMGGDGRFIWSAYAVAGVILIGLLAASVSGFRARRSELKELQRIDDNTPTSDDGDSE